MNIWILLITAVTAQHLYHPQNFFRISRALSNPASLTSWRFIRNAGNDSLRTTVSSLKKVSRITNGIYLLQALIAGQITPDSLISELLHFGSVNPTEISEIDSSKIQKAVDDLKSFSEESGSNQDVQKVEKVFDGLEKILKEIDGIGDLNGWKDGKETFKTELNTLSTKGGDKKPYDGMENSASNWMAAHSTITENDGSASSQEFVDINRALEKLKTSIKKLEKSEPPFKFNSAKSAMDGISPVIKAAKGAEVFDSVTKSLAMDDSKQTAYEEYIESFTKNVAGFDSHLTNFQTVNALLSSRKSKYSLNQVAHTFGLAAGSSDFSAMILDVNDPWIRKIVKTNSLKAALKHFEETGGLLETVNNALVFDEKAVEDFNQLLQLFQTVQNTYIEIGNNKPDIAKGKECVRPAAADIELKNFPKFNQSLEEIDKKMGDSVEKIKALRLFFQNPEILELCEKVKQLCDEAIQATDIKPSISKFVKDADVEKLNGYMTSIKTASSGITVLWESIKTSAENAMKNFDELNQYQKRLGDHYSVYFKCLDDLELEDVFKTVAGLRKVRELKNDKKFSSALDNGMKVVEKVAGTKTNLDNIKESISGFKGLNASEFNGLEDLQDASVHSKTIGMAVEGISNMEIALEKKNDVVMIEKSNLDVVENNKGKMNDATHLDSLLDLPSKVAQMYVTLETFRGSVLPFSDSEILVNQSAIFTNAKSVSGVHGDFLKMRDSVEELKQIVPAEAAKLDKVRKALETMYSLELDFSGYQKSFDECKGSLKALDTFFMEYAKKNTPVAPPQGQNQQGNNSGGFQGSQGNSAKNEEEKSKLLMFIGITIGAIIFLVLLLHILLFIFARKKLKQIYPCFWRKEKMITDPDQLLFIIVNHLKTGVEAILDTNQLEEAKTSPGEAMYMYFLHLYNGDITVCVVDKKLLKEPQPTDCAYIAELIGNTMVNLSGYGNRFKNNYLHGNVFELLNKKQLLLTQAPQAKKDAQNGTITKFWWMTMQYKAENIAMLTPLNDFDKHDKYFPEKSGESMKIDDLTLKCISFKTDCEKKLEIRVITGNFGNEKPFTVTHFCYPDWVSDTWPPVAPILVILDAVLKSKGASVVHCGDGLARTGSFALSAYMSVMLTETNRVDFREGLMALQSSRTRCIDIPETYAFSSDIFMKYFASKAKLNKSDLKADFEYLRRGFDDLQQGAVEHKNRQKQDPML
ncbi:hypothetical protein B9Z55_002993 [Caenorhabditis nigoni]|uniref:Tyrosine-protein phosphatase domain-containing protein n=1 Tax=Caenorhabditis nigoni TaxID=1611254 RepID=A0A2G5VNE7_9PELO|nr:hypothetical protein B9Z55_002993 [Caenorhabditis nigoni]